MKLAFVYPTFHTQPFNENLPTVDDEFGLFPHLGFGWATRAATEAGWEVRLIDGLATRATIEDVIEMLRGYGPDLVAFSAHACQTFRFMLGWAKRIKAELGLATLVGGYEAKVFPEEIMGHGCFDFLCAGESITFLREFLPAFERGGGYDKVADLYYWDNGALRLTFPNPSPLAFSQFPTPDRSIYPNELYYSHVSQRKNFTIGMSEVGCPYPCSFCCMRNSGFEGRSPAQLIAEMEECVALGIHEIDWFDPLMLHDRERIMEMAREHKRRNLDIIWSCRSRIDSLTGHRSDGKVDEEYIRTIAEGGCRRIYFGVESGDDLILAKMMKGQKATQQIRKVLECVKEHGIMALGFFILGAPGDTPETCEKTIAFSLTLPLAYAQYQIAIIKPHTELEKKYIIDATGIDYWREYMRGTIDEHLLPTPWTDMTRPELEKLAREAYFRFYARPRYALPMVARIESFDEFQRYFRVGLQLLIRPLRPLTGQHLPAWRRGLRATGTFFEATMTAANPGARHPVFRAGGGVKGAWRLAKKEYFREETDVVLTPERAVELREIIAAKTGTAPAATPAVTNNKYVPVMDTLRAAMRKAEKAAPEAPEAAAPEGEPLVQLRPKRGPAAAAPKGTE
jgi:anaerobic magnesium-protoporphyrin IX monomethyl ester cyclase